MELRTLREEDLPVTEPQSCPERFISAKFEQPGLFRLWAAAALLLVLWVGIPLSAHDKGGVQYGMGLIINVPYPPAEVAQVIQDIVQDGIIRGSKEYNKDEYVSGAVAAPSTPVFPAWTEGGQVFYKVREHCIDPRNFKDAGDVGTLAVRYVVQPQGEKNTVLRIDAVFVEDFRRTSHPSNGSVEVAEYKDIHDHIDEIESMKMETAEAEKVKEEKRAEMQHPAASQDAAAESSSSQPVQSSTIVEAGSLNSPPAETLEQHIKDLRQQVEGRVKSPGAALKSAPFHTASTLQSLLPGTEVLIDITTPYWLGIETHDGQHGWVRRDDLEPIP